jgi:hypothetical protein
MDMEEKCKDFVAKLLAGKNIGPYYFYPVKQ